MDSESFKYSEKHESVSHSVMSNPLRPHGLQPTRLLCPWNSPGKNTGVGSNYLLQGIFPTQGLNLGLLHCRWTRNHLNHQGSPNAGLAAVGCKPLLISCLQSLSAVIWEPKKVISATASTFPLLFAMK